MNPVLPQAQLPVPNNNNMLPVIEEQNTSFGSTQQPPNLNLNISLGEDQKGNLNRSNLNKSRMSMPLTVEGSFELNAGYHQPSPTLKNASSKTILPLELSNSCGAPSKPIQRVIGRKIALKQLGGFVGDLLRTIDDSELKLQEENLQFTCRLLIPQQIQDSPKTYTSTNNTFY